jgi:hypothetical protein
MQNYVDGLIIKTMAHHSICPSRQVELTCRVIQIQELNSVKHADFEKLGWGGGLLCTSKCGNVINFEKYCKVLGSHAAENRHFIYFR